MKEVKECETQSQKHIKKRTGFQWVKITFSLSRICEKLTIAQLLFVSN